MKVWNLKNHSVLVTGGTGTIGRAFVERSLELGARHVLVYSRDEAKQATMRAELTDERLDFLLGDVRDADRIRYAIAGVHLVLHAAAMKRVDSCEENPTEAVATNITGSLNVLRACRGRALMISTDKAVHPSSVYGTTKLAAEQLWTRWRGGCQASVFRCGNVLGSTGSVIARWKEQVARGEPISMTDPAATRFWIGLPRMVELIGFAVQRMKGGEIFVPRLRSSGVRELASAIGASAERAAVIGLRRGEKKHEALLDEHELEDVHDDGPFWIIDPARRGPVATHESYLSNLVPRLSPAELRDMLS